MASLIEKVNVEMENISAVLKELKEIKDKPDKTLVELAGTGTFLHNVYNGMENILKQILNSKGIQIPKCNRILNIYPEYKGKKRNV